MPGEGACELRVRLASYSHAGTLIATFVDARQSALAVNWARQLASVGPLGLVGLVTRLDPSVEAALQHAGAGLFCTEGEAMRINAQSGRWAEVAPLLRSGFSVLLSDVDVGWARSPLPYLRAVLRAHPHASLLISSNLGDANFSQSPLAADASALELEEPTPYVGDTSSGGLNIGIVFFHRRAAPQLEALLAQWVALLTTRRRDGRLALASFDQGLINQALRRHARSTAAPQRARTRAARARTAH